MATRKELRAGITDARAAVQRAIVEAAQVWDRPGPPEAEGEEAWSSRQAIEHTADAEVFFASRISTACGYPELEMQRHEFATAADAAEGYARATAKTDGVIQHVSDEDLPRKLEEGRLSGMSVEAILELTAHHAHDHARQAISAAQ